MRSTVVAKVTSLAAAQWGLITVAQASSAGVSRMQLQRMVGAGLLDRVMHGVYSTPGTQGDQHLALRAAWLTLNPGTAAEERLANLPVAGVVSHASAAQLLGLGDLTADEHEFTLPHRHQSTRAGVRARKGALRPDEVTIAEGLPVTTAARTIADLLISGHELEHVATIVAHAVRRDLIDGPTLEASLLPAARRHNARDGAELLLRLLDLAGLGVRDLEHQVLDNDLGRELVRRAAHAQYLAAMTETAGVLAALESIIQNLRATMMNSPDMQAITEVMQAQRLYDTPGMRAALTAASRASARTVAVHAANDTGPVDPEAVSPQGLGQARSWSG